ncbi:unnamed protein product [Heterosigma akashiwo]|uniref:Sugar phosphate transporter domain-containing protein n=1 Tax=Heterosigma akashiwo TaxID=2829 RepID=A0A6V1SC99_HETAK|mmetsp:Transcript_40010/g.70043  ORF Transcript_40010/g.70043 Transcript_40010/m.70043 type:complete len:400 (+) Transcript_40010:19-1218(+)
MLGLKKFSVISLQLVLICALGVQNEAFSTPAASRGAKKFLEKAKSPLSHHHEITTTLSSHVPTKIFSTQGGAAEPVADGAEGKMETKQKIKVGIYLALWYVISIGYNLDTKKIFNVMPLPWTLMSVQLLIGSIWVSSMWALGIRKVPKLDAADLKALAPTAALNTLSLLTAAIGLGAGTVSFVHIVKSAEPLFTALFGALLLGQFMAPAVYAALLPVVAGVALASAKELSFSWTAMGGAMGSNLTSALRAVLAKKQLGGGQLAGKNMGGANLYAVLTVLGAGMLLPAALLVEGAAVGPAWRAALQAGHTAGGLLLPTLLSGLYLYWYYEVSFLALDAISPVTHAVANTMRRVFLVASAIFVFKTPVTPLNLVGSAMAIGGVFLYSMVKDFYDNKKKTGK